jgi:hypothetical protein
MNLSGLRLAEADQGADWQLPVRHLSASSIGLASKCPEQWRRKHLLKEEDVASTALVIGNAFHETVRRNFETKMKEGVDLPEAEVTEVFLDCWNTHVAKQLERGGIDWGTSNPSEAALKALQISKQYIAEVAPRIMPLAVEQRFNAKLIPGLPVPILGFIDLVTEGMVVDYKTSSRAIKSMKADWMIQGRIYQMVTGKDFGWHVITKAKEPSIWTPLESPDLLLPYSSQGIEEAQRHVRTIGWTLNHYYLTLGWENPWPTSGLYSGACAMCPMVRACPAWKREAA